MMAEEQFSLVWNSFPSNLSSGLYSLLTDEHLVDVTLAAEGKIFHAHKLILSVCSSYFRDLFKGNTCKHPIVILKDVNSRDLSAMLNFMYQGEVSIKQEDINNFLKVAETLQIKGLTKDKTEKDKDDLCTRMESDMKTEMIDDDLDVSVESADNFNAHDHESTQSTVRITSPSPTFRDDDNYKQKSAESPVASSKTEDTLPENLSDSPAKPLDFTSETRKNFKPSDGVLDYTYGVGCSTSGAAVSEDEVPVLGSDASYPDYYEEPPGVADDISQKDPGLESSNQAKSPKGRRTVRGIPHSALPLETTLRVVSELGPTLRVERGKVVRMYSCPWCLRHFTRKENLKLHVRYIHGPLESLTCKLCGNKYKNSNSLRVHSYLYHNTKRNKHNKPSLVTSNV
ncbi:protein tramtrack, beta isoform [Microplitis demolitor]|uniref:protein tramtrack, beta isoform n=1 Tax=Microplitis demolitor TaxID=69319 RepID=UPI0004CCD21E|nr:protein tramtrack, beta isoform [Microplitis demolitor]